MMPARINSDRHLRNLWQVPDLMSLRPPLAAWGPRLLRGAEEESKEGHRPSQASQGSHRQRETQDKPRPAFPSPPLPSTPPQAADPLVLPDHLTFPRVLPC
jgi:hypothetical protein